MRDRGRHPFVASVITSIILALAWTWVGQSPSWSAEARPAIEYPRGLFGAAETPQYPSTPDGNAVEVGVRFRAAADGLISGIRFFKGSGNEGPHVAHLWTAAGSLLASAPFIDETAAGWQEVTFATPVSITAGTIYVASYHAPAGRVALTLAYFRSRSVVSGVLEAPGNGRPNGVYKYGASGFPSSSSNGNNYWVDVVFTSASFDTTAPAIEASTPADGASGVSVDETLRATFTEALDPETVGAENVEIRDGANGAVATAIDYPSAARTVSLRPMMPLASATTYTLILRGGPTGLKDLAGNTMAADVLITFTTAPPPVSPGPCPCRLWPNDPEPQYTQWHDDDAAELGVRFRASANGLVTGIRFYKGLRNTGTHVGNLWNTDGTLLGSAVFTRETAAGWQEVTLVPPAPIVAGRDYIASYHTTTGRYAFDPAYFANRAVTSGVLTAPRGRSGVYRRGASGFPGTKYAPHNYWVDVVFTAGGLDGTAPAVERTSPAAGETNVATTSDVAVTFTEAMDPASLTGTTIELRDGSGAPVASSVSYPSGARTAVLDPATALRFSTTYTVRVFGGPDGVRDVAGNPLALDATWTFTTAAAPVCPCSIWPISAKPVFAQWPDPNPIELGVRFRATHDGVISGIRFYKGAGNVGTHIGSLWSSSGVRLASVTFENETESGWQEARFAAPVPIVAGTIYVASYHAPSGHYAADAWYFARRGVLNPPLEAVANAKTSPNGVFKYGPSGFPTSAFLASNYWVDVLFEFAQGDTTAPSVTSVTPAGGATDVAITATAAAVFDEALDSASVNGSTVALRQGIAPITAAVTYDSSTHTIRIAPATQLAHATVYTVTLKGAAGGIRDVAGNALAADFSWSFTTIAMPQPAVTTLSVFPRGASLSTGGTHQFFASATYPDDTTRDVTAQADWTSSNASVATVTGGFVTAGGPGLATIAVAFGGRTAEAQVQVSDGAPLPPDPVWIAPDIDRTIATVIADATAFLYSGDNPIQTGVAAGAILRQRAAVLRGRTLDRSGAPLPGVNVSIAAHPELGSTRSRADGTFDLAVNGGGSLTVRFGKSGYLPVDRTVEPAWQDFIVVPDVALTALDPAVTTLRLDAPAAIQVARGSAVSDASGTRQAALLVAQNTTASFVLPDGTSVPATTLNVRITEYTANTDGPAAMPAPLPPASAYTYAAELSVDEAIATGAAEVRFNRPVFVYLENFLGFPVGGAVPAASYDRARRAWIPSENGRIVRVLDVAGGFATLDVDGSGTAASQAMLDALGVTDAERQTLASMYTAGQGLWRVPLTHFSPVDFNYAFGLPSGARGANTRRSGSEDDEDSDCEEGSIVECQNRSLGEALEIAGTPFQLVYNSTRLPGRRGAERLQAFLSGAELPDTLKRIDLEVTIAGRVSRQSFDPQPNRSVEIPWDGRDAYGRELQGLQPAIVRIGYVYDGVYLEPSAGNQSFGEPGGPIVFGEMRQEITLWREDRGTIGRRDVLAEQLGGWTISAHHLYEASQQAVDLGTGGRRTSIDVVPQISTAAGSGRIGSTGDGGPATQASFQQPGGMAIGPDGTLYVTDAGVIRRVGTDGIITGMGRAPGDISTVGPDGSLYFVNGREHRVYRLLPDGSSVVVAGTGTSGFSGDGGSATQAMLADPLAVAVAADGTVWVSDAGNGRVRRIDPAGIITTVAGTGEWGYTGDGGPATAAALKLPAGLALTQDGSLLVADGDGSVVRRISPDGIITTFAGTGQFGYSGDGGPATAAELDLPWDISVARDGSVLIADYYNGRVRKVGGDGIITMIAGDGGVNYNGDRRPAGSSSVSPLNIVVGPDSALYINDWTNRRIRRVAPPLPGLSVGDVPVASETGDELYIFDATGRHLRTIDALTGARVYQFEYGPSGLLAGIVDRDNLRTRIERDATGRATAIVSPGGQRTVLSIDGRGLLTEIAAPGSESITLEYVDDGLLTRLTDPMGGDSVFTWDEDGQLFRDRSPTGASLTVASSEIAGLLEATLTTALSRTDTFRIRTLDDGDVERTSIDSAGLQVSATIRPDGSRAVTLPDGTTAELFETGDPRWGMQAPIFSAIRVTTPSGLRSEISAQRTISLSDPTNPLSLEWLTDTVTLNGRVFESTYDAALRQVFTLSGAFRRTITDLDEQGRVTAWRPDGLSPVEFTYDARGRLTGVRQGPRAWSLDYDTSDRLTRVSDPTSRAVEYEYDAYSRLARQRLPGGGVIEFGRNANGLVTSITPPGRAAHSFGYRGGTLADRYTAPGGGAIAYSYNLDDQLTGIALPDGNIGIGYDAGGRVSSVTIPGAAITYTYAPTGTIESVARSGSSTLHYGFDGPLLTGWDWQGPVTGFVGQAYNADHWVTAQSVNDAHVVTFDYDGDGLITRAGDLQIWRDFGTGLLSTTNMGRVGDWMQYDDAGAVSSYAAYDGGSPGDLFSERFTRDEAGRILTRAETVDGVLRLYEYQYDADGRLAAVSVNGNALASYAYDANANRTHRRTAFADVEAVYDGQDRLVSNGAVAYDYNASGQLRSRTSGTTSTTYEYDALANLLAVNTADGRRIEYLVDGRNRRIGKRVDGALVQAFLYGDEFYPLAELDASNTVVSRFVYGSKVNVPDYMVRNGRTYRIVSDYRGSPRIVIDAETGDVVQRMDFDEFGVVTQDTNPGFQPFGFAGGLYDRDTRLTRFGLRDYDAETGRWTTRDPAGFAGGDTNLYAYAGSDPINGVDPSGLLTLADVSNFVSGFGDSLTFGLTEMARESLGINDVVDKCSKAYRAGTAAEIGAEIALTGASGALKNAAKNASRREVRNAARNATRNIPRNGGQVHHSNPLFGHPGGGGTVFPTGGLPPSIHSHPANLELMSKADHLAAHRAMQRHELYGKATVNPATTAARAGRAVKGDCECK